MEGAAAAIVRLQRTYSLAALQLVDVQAGSSSSRAAALCFHVGQQQYRSQDWSAAREWLLAALSLSASESLRSSDCTSSVENRVCRHELLDYLAFVSHKVTSSTV